MEGDYSKQSWNNVSGWYNNIVGQKGHYYHQHLVISNVLKLLDLGENEGLLDVACGNGLLARNIPSFVQYTGVDSADRLISEAIKADNNTNHKYLVADVSKVENFPTGSFSKAALILALQNISNPSQTLINIGKALIKGGKLVVVINHPCFRIPRQSRWEIDIENKLQSRNISSYMSYLEIPINIHPGEKKGPVVWEYHVPLSEYFNMFIKAGLVVLKIEEWISDKKSQGRAAKMEDRARREIPMFMALLLRKD